MVGTNEDILEFRRQQKKEEVKAHIRGEQVKRLEINIGYTSHYPKIAQTLRTLADKLDTVHKNGRALEMEEGVMIVQADFIFREARSVFVEMDPRKDKDGHWIKGA